jgi:hypothetical protein
VSRLVTSRAAGVGRVVGAEELARTVLGVGRAGIPIGHVDDRAILDHHRRLTRNAIVDVWRTRPLVTTAHTTGA